MSEETVAQVVDITVEYQRRDFISPAWLIIIVKRIFWRRVINESHPPHKLHHANNPRQWW